MTGPVCGSFDGGRHVLVRTLTARARAPPPLHVSHAPAKSSWRLECRGMCLPPLLLHLRPLRSRLCAATWAHRSAVSVCAHALVVVSSPSHMHWGRPSFRHPQCASRLHTLPHVASALPHAAFGRALRPPHLKLRPRLPQSPLSLQRQHIQRRCWQPDALTAPDQQTHGTAEVTDAAGWPHTANQAT